MHLFRKKKLLWESVGTQQVGICSIRYWSAALLTSEVSKHNSHELPLLPSGSGGFVHENCLRGQKITARPQGILYYKSRPAASVPA